MDIACAVLHTFHLQFVWSALFLQRYLLAAAGNGFKGFDLISYEGTMLLCTCEGRMLSQQRVNCTLVDNDEEKGNVAVVGGLTGQTAAACKGLPTATALKLLAKWLPGTSEC